MHRAGARTPQRHPGAEAVPALWTSGGLGPSLVSSLRRAQWGPGLGVCVWGGGLGPESTTLGGQIQEGPGLEGGLPSEGAPSEAGTGRGRVGWTHTPPGLPFSLLHPPCHPALPVTQRPRTLPPPQLTLHTPNKHMGCGSFNAVFLQFSWLKLRPLPWPPQGTRESHGAPWGMLSQPGLGVVLLLCNFLLFDQFRKF